MLNRARLLDAVFWTCLTYSLVDPNTAFAQVDPDVEDQPDGTTLVFDDEDEDEDEQTLVFEDDETDEDSAEDSFVVLDEDGATLDGSAGEDDPLVRRKGALGKIWESMYIEIDSRLQSGLQWTGWQSGPSRTLVGVRPSIRLLPAPNLSFYADGFFRAHLDIPFRSDIRWDWNLDLYEAYAKVRTDGGSVTIGRVVIPWGRTRYAALTDRLNPPDHRRAFQNLPSAIALKQPQLAALLQTSFGPIGIEAVLMTLYEPSEGSLRAIDQSGVRGARYQGALVRGNMNTSTVLSEESRAAVIIPSTLLDASSVALRLRNRFLGIDIAASAVYGIDETPYATPSNELKVWLQQDIEGTNTDNIAPCATTNSNVSCVRPFLTHDRLASLGVDFAYGLGIAIIKGEFLWEPRIAGVGGKTINLMTARGFESQKSSRFAGALSLEAGYGDWVEGSVEVFDSVWTDVPVSATLVGVESGVFPRLFGDVHRIAFATDLRGTIGEDVQWNIRGEASPLQIDMLVSADIRYTISRLGLYAGTRADVFTGMPGSPGWMRERATGIQVFVGEGL